jgi:hypothetical protein
MLRFVGAHLADAGRSAHRLRHPFGFHGAPAQRRDPQAKAPGIA